MKILHVFSSNFIAGSVIYVREISKIQKKQGHEVFFATDHPEKIEDFEKTNSYELPVHKRSFFQRIKNVIVLIKIIKKHDIQIVHAHSRGASWLCFFAVWGRKVAYVSSIHSFVKTKAFLNRWIYGQKLIVICKNIQTQLQGHLGLSVEKIKIVPNGFFCLKSKKIQKKQINCFGLVGSMVPKDSY